MLVLILIPLLTVCTTLTASMEGVSNSEEWAYQWYTDESFRFQCHIAGLNMSQTDHVVWETPDKKTLNNPYNDTDYQLYAANNIDGLELLIKKVHSNVHGVYICTLKGQNGAVRGRTIYGLNIHEVKYHDMMDKYRHQLYVGLVATAAFIVPFLTICLVWHFQYVTPEMEAKRQQRKKPYHTNHVMNGTKSGQLDEYVMPNEGNYVYENPEAFTQL